MGPQNRRTCRYKAGAWLICFPCFMRLPANYQHKINTDTMLLCCITIIRAQQQMPMCFSKQKTEWSGEIMDPLILPREGVPAGCSCSVTGWHPRARLRLGVAGDRSHLTAIFQAEQHKTNSRWLLKLIRKEKFYWQKTNGCFCQNAANTCISLRCNRHLSIQSGGWDFSCLIMLQSCYNRLNDISLFVNAII